MAKFSAFNVFNKSNYDLYVFLYVLKLISITTGKLSQHIHVSYILFKKNTSGTGLKLRLVINQVLFSLIVLTNGK